MIQLLKNSPLTLFRSLTQCSHIHHETFIFVHIVCVSVCMRVCVRSLLSVMFLYCAFSLLCFKTVEQTITLMCT